MKSSNPGVKTVYVSLFILTIGLSVIHLSAFTLNEASAKYSSNFEQAASLANDCLGHGDIRCINDNPQTQGEHNVVNTPINSQVSNAEVESPPGPPGPKGEQGPPGPKGDPGSPLPQDIVHVVWVDVSPGPGEVMYKRDGAGFDPTTINLSNNPSNSFLPEIAVSGSNVYVVWNDETSGNNEILFRRSTDGGATFGSTINLSNNPGFSFLPKIAVSGDNVYVVWEDNTVGNNEILYRRSTDGGVTFGSTTNLSANSGNSRSAEIAVSEGNVHVVWSDSIGVNNEILYRVSSDGGATFGSIVNISNNTSYSQIPAIGASGDSVHIVSIDVVSLRTEIFYRSSTDGGVSFSETENLSNTGNFSDLPAISVLGNNVYVVWEEAAGVHREIFYRSSTDGGVSFTDIQNLSNSKGTSESPAQGSSESPAIVVLGSNVHVVWKEFVGGVNSEILYIRSTDGGTVFDPILTNISNNPTGSIAPAIAVS